MKLPDGEFAMHGVASDQVAAAAQALFEPAHMPALSIAIARPEGGVWQGVFGMADLELGVAATPSHRFLLGSVSKAITVTAAARMVSRGMLELDTSIAYWLPDLPEQHRATTLRQLFTHRGGIRHYLPKDLDPTAPGGMISHRRYDTRDDILALFIDDPLVAPPGTEVSYSSYGYSLASMVMEAAAGIDFPSLIAEEIALPFALPSLAMDDRMAIVPGRVRGYFGARELEFLSDKLPGGTRTIEPGSFANVPFNNHAFCWAGAGMVMSMPELARFGAALLEAPGSRISATERALLFTPVTEASEGTPPLGLGWRVDRDGKERLRWHHAGTTPGGRASLVIYPALGLSIALASNTMMAPGDVLGPSARLADACG